MVGILLGLAAFSPAAAAPTNRNPSLPSAGYNCGTLQDILESSKPFFSRNPVKTFREGARFKVLNQDKETWVNKDFVFEFYSRDENQPARDYKSMAEWLQHGSFDGFSVYELGNEGKPFEYSSADAFFERGLLLVIYDLFTIAEDGAVLNKPDNYAESTKCYATTYHTKSQLLMQVLTDITSFRINHVK